MFRKPFSVKSNTNMRNSDRRKLLSRMHCADLLTTSKSQVAHVKLLANNGAHMNAYTFDRNPLLFEIDGDTNLYPTGKWEIPQIPQISSSFVMVLTNSYC
ncbi:unnamed protein product [Anisakis simplex]|uniref:Eukaryotic translation initiation factor 2D (inferred by orthology to a human protein) n=1 Tax=Anisakis simplex TaxID=6269 RepID=A0A0M3KHC1_ANISI|nr:unnamed protein product [Anisakis simplex]